MFYVIYRLVIHYNCCKYGYDHSASGQLICTEESTTTEATTATTEATTETTATESATESSLPRCNSQYHLSLSRFYDSSQACPVQCITQRSYAG